MVVLALVSSVVVAADDTDVDGAIAQEANVITVGVEAPSAPEPAPVADTPAPAPVPERAPREERGGRGGRSRGGRGREDRGPRVMGLGDHVPGFIEMSFEERCEAEGA